LSPTFTMQTDTQRTPRQRTTPSPSPRERSLARQPKFYSHGALHQSYLLSEPTRWPRRARAPPPTNARVSTFSSSSASTSPATPYSPPDKWANEAEEEEGYDIDIDKQSYPDIVDIFYLSDTDGYKSEGRPDSVVLPDDASGTSQSISSATGGIVEVIPSFTRSGSGRPISAPSRMDITPKRANLRVANTPAPPIPTASTTQSQSTPVSPDFSKPGPPSHIRHRRSKPEVSIPQIPKPPKVAVAPTASPSHSQSAPISPGSSKPGPLNRFRRRSRPEIAIPAQIPKPPKMTSAVTPTASPSQSRSAPSSPNSNKPGPFGRILNRRSRPEIEIPPQIPKSPKITSPAVMHLMQSAIHPYALKATRKCDSFSFS
jgi:hypothetical protein